MIVHGPVNVPAMLPVHASDQYARNVFNFISPFIKDGELTLDWEDEVLAGSVLTRDGVIVDKTVMAAVMAAAQARAVGPARRRRERVMIDGYAAIYIFMLAAFVGYEVISRVPVILHTPLMSGSNFVHGIVVVGAMVALGQAETRGRADHRLRRRAARHRQRGRRLRRHRAHARDVQEQQGPGEGQGRRGRPARAPRRATMRADLIQISYIAASLLFILGLKGMSSPRTARTGIIWAGVGMLVATAITFATPDMGNYVLMTLAMAIGGIIAWAAARKVQMTDMPQMVAVYNGMGGGAAAAIAAAEFLRVARPVDELRRPRHHRRAHRLRRLQRQHDRLRQAAGVHQEVVPLPRARTCSTCWCWPPPSGSASWSSCSISAMSAARSTSCCSPSSSPRSPTACS